MSAVKRFPREGGICIFSVAIIAAVAGGPIFRDLRTGDRADGASDERPAAAAGDQGSRSRADRTSGERAPFSGCAGDQCRRRDEPEGEQTYFQITFHTRWGFNVFRWLIGSRTAYPEDDRRESPAHWELAAFIAGGVPEERIRRKERRDNASGSLALRGERPGSCRLPAPIVQKRRARDSSIRISGMSAPP